MDHTFYMQRAFDLALQAADRGEVPVGAVIVFNNVIIAQAYNQPIATHDPTAHAEIIALRLAGKKLENYRLNNTTMYVTLEPCSMCAAAMVHARIAHVIFGASDQKSGAVCSHTSFFLQPFLNHQVTWEAGIMEKECGQLLSDFFKSKRR